MIDATSSAPAVVLGTPLLPDAIWVGSGGSGGDGGQRSRDGAARRHGRALDAGDRFAGDSGC